MHNFLDNIINPPVKSRKTQEAINRKQQQALYERALSNKGQLNVIVKEQHQNFRRTLTEHQERNNPSEQNFVSSARDSQSDFQQNEQPCDENILENELGSEFKRPSEMESASHHFQEDNQIQNVSPTRSEDRLSNYFPNGQEREGEGEVPQNCKKQFQVSSVNEVVELRSISTPRDISQLNSLESLISKINEARLQHKQFLSWFSEEKMIFAQLIQNIIDQVVFWQEQQEQLRHEQQQAAQQPKQQEANSELFQAKLERRVALETNLIKEQAEIRYQYQIQKLQQEISGLKQKCEAFNQSIPKQSPQKVHSRENLGDNSYQSLRQTVVQMQKEIEEKNIQIQSLREFENENQKLNEHIFDLEQKIEGIELEVQLRVRTKVLQVQSQLQSQGNNRNLQEIPQASTYFQSSKNMINESNFMMHQRNQEVSTLKREIQKNQKIIQYYKKQLSDKDVQFQEFQKIIKFREQQIEKNEEDVHYEWSELEKERQALSMREQELIKAEENITKKISDLRVKEAELIKWEDQIRDLQSNFKIQKQKFDSEKQTFTLEPHQQSISHQRKEENSHNMYRNTGHGNLYNRNRLQMRNDGGGSFRQQRTVVDIPELPIGRKVRNDYQKSLEYENGSRIKENMSHHPSSSFDRQAIDDLNHSYSKNQSNLPSHFYQSVKPSQINAGRPSRVSHHPPSTAHHQKHQYQMHSYKNRPSGSKSRSKEKSIVGKKYRPESNYSISSYSAHQANKTSSAMNGIGPKLQRLREQIKREIDSINH